MHLRRPARRAALAVAALVLAPALSSCGFNYATDLVDTPASGVNERDKSVDVLNALVVAEHPNRGTFIASLANNEPEPATLTSLGGALAPRDFEPVTVAGEGFVDLSDDGGVVVTGEFEVGDFVEATLEFDTGEIVTVQLPVYGNCDEFEGLDVSDEPTVPADEETVPPADTAETEGAEAEGAPYTCDYLAPGGYEHETIETPGVDEDEFPGEHPDQAPDDETGQE